MAALNKLYYTKKLKQKAKEELRHIAKIYQQALDHTFNACINASAQLLHLKKVREKVRLKEYRLVKQGLRKLKTDKQKELNSLEVELLGALVAY